MKNNNGNGKLRITDLMLNSQLGFQVIHNETPYQITLDYVGESLLTGNSSLTFYINRKKFMIVAMQNMVITYKREINDLISNDPILFSSAIDEFDLMLDDDTIKDSRIDQRLLLFVYLMGDLSSLRSQDIISSTYLTIKDVYLAVDRLKQNLTRCKYKTQVHIRVLSNYLESVRDQYFSNPSDNSENDPSDNSENDQLPNEEKDNLSDTFKLTKSQLELKIHKQITKNGKSYLVTEDTNTYNNLKEIADFYKVS